jgi:hypothetical protein
VAEERAIGLAEVDTRRAELLREIAAMQMHQEAQVGRVELNIGGHRFETSVQALRRVPHTFFDACFSGRYAQDVCSDGSIFVDRDGKRFGHILEYMRDGHVSIAEASARPSVSLLWALKRGFAFYRIELSTEQRAYLEQSEVTFVMGGTGGNNDSTLSSMERYVITSGQLVAAAAMSTARRLFGAYVVAGELYVTGGCDGNGQSLSLVEKYSPSSDLWSSVTPLATPRYAHAAVAVGSAMYVLEGRDESLMRGSMHNRVHKFDSTQNTWNDVAPMPEARYACAACVLGTDIYVFGGNDSLGTEYASVLKYDAIANIWTTLLAPMLSAFCFSGVATLDGQIYVTGIGASGKDVILFDPTSGAWHSLAPTMHSRRQGSVFVLGGCVHVAGGNGSYTGKSVKRYDAATDTWTAVADMLEGRALSCAVTIPAARPAEEQNLFDALICIAKATDDSLMFTLLYRQFLN